MSIRKQMIDFRSDTVTKPTSKMRIAMTRAEVGDDVYGEDPTVNELEALAASVSGKESALFVATGTQSNLIALLVHCERGDEYIVGQQGHTYKYEGGGAAVLGSIQPQPLDYEKDGTLDLSAVEAAIKPDDIHFARTRLLCLENTQAGRPLPIKYLEDARFFCDRTGLSLHLDGARLFNASVGLGVDVTTITQFFDTVSICLSKGLGAPVGSILCGPADLIRRARRWRKVLGGGMRQAGIIAAAGIYALHNHVERLELDHTRARLLFDKLLNLNHPKLKVLGAHTNMVFISFHKADVTSIAINLRAKNIFITPGKSVRLVTHLDVNDDDVEIFVAELVAALNQVD
ncbi:MAG: low-specificity L-threonine aldolase [Proteobacteria bacterium]|nr:low-specificity L-threonine aldolase [Pseudomonadota bacterium]MDA1330860.1 low-specificity L-threonine aldolase [Pseudomonadota bacterium]